MDIEYPSYYEEFRCIAGKCKDSCCRGWCIDVDRESKKRLDRIKGPLGDKIKAKLKEGEGNYCFPLEENGDCPFLLKSGLCEMILSEGEDALCNVCAAYPRVKQICGNYAQYDLNASCEEAFRFILKWDGRIVRAVEEGTGEKLSREQERELIHVLAFRSALWEELSYLPTDFNTFFLHLFPFFLEGESQIFPQTEHPLRKNRSIHELLTKWQELEEYPFLSKERYSAFLKWQDKSTEINKDFGQWKELFKKYKMNPEMRFNSLSKEKRLEWEKQIVALCRYYLFRYTLLSIKEASLLPVFSLLYQSIEWIYTAFVFINTVSDEEKKQFSCFFGEEPSVLRIAVFFSKELEHDEGNIRNLLYFLPLFN